VLGGGARGVAEHLGAGQRDPGEHRSVVLHCLLNDPRDWVGSEIGARNALRDRTGGRIPTAEPSGQSSSFG
jgi:hypothetical protein